MKFIRAFLIALFFSNTAFAQDFSSASAFSLPIAALAQTPSSAAGLQNAVVARDWVFGPLEAGSAGRSISTRLLLWSIPWMGAGLLGLTLTNDEQARGFWGMSGAWAFINSAIAMFGLLTPEPELGNLRTILYVNAGLDVLYVAAGIFMLTRDQAYWKGAGWGVIVQGGFLLIFDLVHALIIA
jgi:hypothetical protein